MGGGNTRLPRDPVLSELAGDSGMLLFIAALSQHLSAWSVLGQWQKGHSPLYTEH